MKTPSDKQLLDFLERLARGYKDPVQLLWKWKPPVGCGKIGVGGGGHGRTVRRAIAHAMAGGIKDP